MGDKVNQTIVGYQGNVELSWIINGKRVSTFSHNEGLPALQESFCRIMTGNYRGKTDIPQYLDLRRSVNSGVTYSSMLKTSRLPLTGASWYLNGSTYEAKFTGVISSDMLVGAVSETSTDLYMLYLYTDAETGTGERDLARLSVTAEDVSKIVPGVNSIVEWIMRLVNPTD